ncbi:MAG: hypothetical protein AB7O24_18925 [Kofleriaceae bacterium]
MKKAILAVGLAATASYGAWRWWSSEPATADANLTLNRVWIDHIPRNDRDMIQIFVAITEEPIGVFQQTSQWKMSAELFTYEAHGNEIRAVFPQNGDREKISAKATRCNENGMDFCLELSNATRGVKRYFSRKGWEIEGASTLDDIQHRADKLLDTAK